MHAAFNAYHYCIRVRDVKAKIIMDVAIHPTLGERPKAYCRYKMIHNRSIYIHYAISKS